MIAGLLALAQATVGDPAPATPPAPPPPAVAAVAELWTVDQIRFPASADKAAVAGLAADHSMAAVVRRLQRAGIAFKRVRAELDTAKVPAAVLDQIRALPKTEPFVVPQGDVLTVNLIVGRRAPGTPRPLSEGEQAAEQLLAAMHADDNYRAAMPKVIEAMIGNLAQGGDPSRRAELRRIVSEEFGSVVLTMLPATHGRNRALLAEYFSVGELRQLARFYQSKLGEKVTATMPAIQLEMLQFSQAAGRAAMQAAMPRILARMRASNMAVPKGV